MQMPFDTDMQQYCGTPEASFFNPIPRDSSLDMPVATENAIGKMLWLGAGTLPGLLTPSGWTTAEAAPCKCHYT